jgi:hypothetical protein
VKFVLFFACLSLALAMFGTGSYQMASAPHTTHAKAFWAAAYFVLCGVFLGMGAAVLVLL